MLYFSYDENFITERIDFMADFIVTNEYPHNVRDLLRVSVANFADKPAILVKRNQVYRAYTYRRLRSDIDALGTALIKRGFLGKKILILGDNGYEWALALLTALSGDFVAVPLDKTLSATDVAQLCQYTEAAAILYSDRYPEAVAALPEDVAAIPFSSIGDLLIEGRAQLASGDTSFLLAKPKADAPALLLLSPGVNTAPRDVMLTGKNLCFTAVGISDALELESTDSFLSLLPLHHAYELICGLLTPLTVGASVAFGDGLHAVMKNINEVHPTVLVTAPVIAEALWRKVQKMLSAAYGKLADAEIAASNLLPQHLALPLKQNMFEAIHYAFGGSLRTIVCGGAMTQPHVAKGLRDVGFVAVEAYGPTECGAIAAINPIDDARYGSVGLPIGDALIDVYNRGEDGTGEIRIKSEGTMLGYYKNEGATTESVRDGWFYTGDLGYLDEDGYLFVTGRKKNVLIRASGRSVFPEELEKLLCEQPFVKEAVVVGFVNEKKRDYDLVAVVYPDKEKLAELYGENYTIRDEETEIESALEKVNAALPDYKRMDMFLLRENEFEKNASNKIRRAGVAASVSEDYFQKKS